MLPDRARGKVSHPGIGVVQARRADEAKPYGALNLRESAGGGGAHLRRPVFQSVNESRDDPVVFEVRDVFYRGAAHVLVLIVATL